MLNAFSRHFTNVPLPRSKQFQKSLTKQGLKFMLNTKVISADKRDGKVFIKTESAKGGKEEEVSMRIFSHRKETCLIGICCSSMPMLSSSPSVAVP